VENVVTVKMRLRPVLIGRQTRPRRIPRTGVIATCSAADYALNWAAEHAVVWATRPESARPDAQE
jgi:alkanesulfonate monooxygenase SsuD/methylene tetrahydromethanopterin reductase-like flavin-dependent oxidoreductase (luciferase family)